MPIYRGPERRMRNLYVLHDYRAPFTLRIRRWKIPVPRPVTLVFCVMTSGALVAYAMMRA